VRPRMAQEWANRFYSFFASFYDLTFANPPVISSIRRRGVEHLNLGEGDTVVELGCGTGANFPYLREEVGGEGKIIGVDPAKGMLEKARKKKEKNNWKNVELVQKSAENVDIEEELDAVLTSFSICVIGNPPEVIEQWSEKLEKGRFANMIISRSEKDTLLPVNLFMDIFEILTDPSTYKGKIPPIGKHERQQREGIEKLEEISQDFQYEEHLLGVIKIYSGEIEN
jgi:ubiquinone/menaquinone biosynthesis C-methylase UbiE